MNRFLACLLLAGAVLPAGALAQARETLADAARLRRKRAAPRRRQRQGAQMDRAGAARLLRSERRAQPDRAVEARRALDRSRGRHRGDDVENAASANYLVHFDENGVSGKAGYCFARARGDKDRVFPSRRAGSAS
jgi:hypothetical protein